MKKYILKSIALIMLSIIVFNFSGCSVFENTPENDSSYSSMTPQQKQKHVEAFLLKKYGQYYYVDFVDSEKTGCFKVIRDGYTGYIKVWCDDYGNVIDGKFLNDLADEIKSTIESVVKTEIDECIVDVNCRDLEKKPTKLWTASDDMKELLLKETFDVYIKVFVSESENVTDDTLNTLIEKLDFCEGKLHVYICKDLDDLNTDSYNYSSADYVEAIKKDDSYFN
ncbi:MAG: hypothetical protein IKU25_06055 [Clostridia bacterium]|nr:hypothetical protein [Clostridia bacterium]